VGKEADKDLYEHKVMCLQELEHLSSQGLIDLYYGDETGVSTQGYCPYGWQGRAEKVSVAALPISRQRLNCFGCISRINQFYYATTSQAIDGQFIFEQLEAFSLTVHKPTFLVLDNARVHKTEKILRHFEHWQQRGLYIFYLPPYSPHLNIAETLWRVMKGRWLEVKDYLSADSLFKATQQYLSEVGTKRTINYTNFN
jgi:transposase